jgi:hypothetical protein
MILTFYYKQQSIQLLDIFKPYQLKLKLIYNTGSMPVRKIVRSLNLVLVNCSVHRTVLVLTLQNFQVMLDVGF